MMTNAQAALIAAATWYSGDDAPLETVLGYADRMESHLDDRGRQEATSAPQAAENLPSGSVGPCRACGAPLWPMDGTVRHIDSRGMDRHTIHGVVDPHRP